MDDNELFERLAIAALTGLAGTRQTYTESIARDAVNLAAATLAEIKKREETQP